MGATTSTGPSTTTARRSSSGSTVAISEVDGAVNPYFLYECRKQKERLSNLSGNKQVVIREHLDGVLFKRPLDHETLEGLIAAEVEKAASMVERAKGRGHEVDTVVLIGGSSRVPLVDRRLRETLRVEPRKFANKDYAVAIGAAYYASVLKIPPREQLRRALEVAWSGGKLGREEIERLGELVEELELDKGEIKSIQRGVLGATLEEVLVRQREQYRDAVEEGWICINALAVEFGVSESEAAEIDYEIMGDLKEASLLAQRSKPKAIVPLDPQNLILAQTLSGHTSRVDSVAFSPDGQLLASGSQDKTVKLWEPQSGRFLSTLNGHTDFVRSVAFSSDGQLLASGSVDGTVNVWGKG